jgi:hypothetical protein
MDSYSNQNLFLFVLSISLILIFTLLVIREIVMWYWEINARIDLQKETNRLLRELLEKQ